MNEAFRIYRIENGFVVAEMRDGKEHLHFAFTDDDDKEIEAVSNVLYHIARELLAGNAPPGTRLKIETYNKHGESEPEKAPASKVLKVEGLKEYMETAGKDRHPPTGVTYSDCCKEPVYSSTFSLLSYCQKCGKPCSAIQNL